MNDSTTFHFVTDGIHAALQRATEAAGGQDIRLGGGIATIRQYLRARWSTKCIWPSPPIFLGAGEHLFVGIDVLKLGYRCTEHVPTSATTHVVVTRP